MVIGKRKPFLLAKTDQAQIKKYEEQFREFQNAAAAE